MVKDVFADQSVLNKLGGKVIGLLGAGVDGDERGGGEDLKAISIPLQRYGMTPVGPRHELIATEKATEEVGIKVLWV